MPVTDQRVDVYIAGARPFAQPILTHLRAAVHEACPEVVETIKWGMPSFEYRGMLCGMAAFKAHCTFGFWHGERVLGAASRNKEAMGDLGRISTVADLPSKARIKALVRVAMALNEKGVKRVTRKAAKKPAARVPADLARALKSRPAAAAHFARFPPGQRREYIEWITDAKTDATRARRLGTALEWIAQGKYRNWKYM